jgi:Uma2 family endonuclease
MTTTISKKPQTRTTLLPRGTARIRKGVVHLTRPKYDGLKISRKDFDEWLREPDGWKYEWNKGVIEINEVSMTLKEQYIVKNINRAFSRTMAYANGDGIFAEVDCDLTDEQMRRPDLMYLTDEQIRLGRIKSHVIPSFVMEVISPNDQDRKMEQKLDEFFAAGVLCVWYIRPESQRVSVYTSPTSVRICAGEEVCSAIPALEFAMQADEIFA